MSETLESLIKNSQGLPEAPPEAYRALRQMQDEVLKRSVEFAAIAERLRGVDDEDELWRLAEAEDDELLGDLYLAAAFDRGLLELDSSITGVYVAWIAHVFLRERTCAECGEKFCVECGERLR